MGHAINKLFLGIEKYKIRSYIIYLPENQWKGSSTIQGKLRGDKESSSRSGGDRHARRFKGSSGEQGELVALGRRSSRLENEREASVVVVNSRKRKIRAKFLLSSNDANNTCIVEWWVGFGFNADEFKKMNPIKINSHQLILRRLISGNLSTDISNIGCFLLQTI